MKRILQTKANRTERQPCSSVTNYGEKTREGEKEREREAKQQQEARNWKGNEERERRETGAEERRRSQRLQAEAGVGEEGEQVDTRESEPPADDRRTAEEYKRRKKTRGERKGEAERNKKTNDRP